MENAPVKKETTPITNQFIWRWIDSLNQINDFSSDDNKKLEVESKSNRKSAVVNNGKYVCY